jgi:hypothetical protein
LPNRWTVAKFSISINRAHTTPARKSTRAWRGLHRFECVVSLKKICFAETGAGVRGMMK